MRQKKEEKRALEESCKLLESRLNNTSDKLEKTQDRNSVQFKQIVKNQEKAETNEKINYFQGHEMYSIKKETEEVRF